MRLSDFDYHLPPGLIAQHPSEPRDAARLMILDRSAGTIRHDIFRNIADHLPGPCLFVINNSRVVPVRLLGVKSRNGSSVEILLLKKIDARHFEAMLKPLRRIREGEPLEFPGGIRACLVDREKRIVRFEKAGVLKVLERFGHIPLPPYIRRPDEERDREDYQTVYAKKSGSVASPTAGLHFTDGLLKGLRRKGHAFSEVTLHVNYGTFKPVETEDVTRHPMHTETYEIPSAALRSITETGKKGRKVLAVGTTSCRTIESYARTKSVKRDTALFLYPGAAFALTDVLLTNFHLPRTTLLMLVSAFAGTDLVRRAYAEAVRERYRFFSYGDAMLIV
ncbi:MAG: tRNA preQ1(34) S-adenosylmethionine ribosyltransferase-isomerase QueA [Elusimicrobia bacterium]|nr:tRNA preQ1(34) S-adenosylmethionine ribosyltransferase-isomerase QueA [Elusimicrobiota bacterium]